MHTQKNYETESFNVARFYWWSSVYDLTVDVESLKLLKAMQTNDGKLK